MKKNQSLGQFLKAQRLARNLTQWEVARELGYSSAQFVSNIERDLCSPPLNQLKNIVDLYQLDPDKLFDLMMQEKSKQLRKLIYGK